MVSTLVLCAMLWAAYTFLSRGTCPMASFTYELARCFGIVGVVIGRPLVWVATPLVKAVLKLLDCLVVAPVVVLISRCANPNAKKSWDAEFSRLARELSQK